MLKQIPLTPDKYSPQYCPDCGPEAGYMDILYFLGIQPDGYVCGKCKGYFDDVNGELKKLAELIE